MINPKVVTLRFWGSRRLVEVELAVWRRQLVAGCWLRLVEAAAGCHQVTARGAAVEAAGAVAALESR